jgi:putative membrane protein
MNRSEFLPYFMRRMLSRVGLYALLVGGYAAVPAFLMARDRLQPLADVPGNIHAALALVLGWLLVFRTNTSYARWWEARTLWGNLINTTRNLSLKVARLIPAPAEDMLRVRRLLSAFAWVLKDHLRDGVSFQDSDIVEGEEIPKHVPTYLVSRLYDQMSRWKLAGLIDGNMLIVIDEDLRKLLEIVGGCERIRNTRIARSYRTFARQCVFLYLATLPWGIAHDFGWWTIPVTALVSYFMLGLETAAEHTEEPFGCDDDDLDLDSLCRVIDASLDEIYLSANGSANQPVRFALRPENDNSGEA